MKRAHDTKQTWNAKGDLKCTLATDTTFFRGETAKIKRFLQNEGLKLEESLPTILIITKTVATWKAPQTRVSPSTGAPKETKTSSSVMTGNASRTAEVSQLCSYRQHPSH